MPKSYDEELIHYGKAYNICHLIILTTVIVSFSMIKLKTSADIFVTV